MEFLQAVMRRESSYSTDSPLNVVSRSARWLPFIATITLCIASTACRSDAIIYEPLTPLDDRARTVTMQDVSDAIERASQSRRWDYRPISEGLAFGELAWGRHIARTLIAYDAEGFEIHYLGSANLRERDGMIHPAFNKHVRALEAAILEELTRDDG